LNVANEDLDKHSWPNLCSPPYIGGDGKDSTYFEILTHVENFTLYNWGWCVQCACTSMGHLYVGLAYVFKALYWFGYTLTLTLIGVYQISNAIGTSPIMLGI
jgi:hypothetical protein